ncbi:MAG: SCP2 sterol-binding domain-containing protein [Chloroflexi bacterium]|nr:SCP2 sterol-binding domain-containing protein [Chloroflexota bacterium]
MPAFESKEALEKVLAKLAELVQSDPAFITASKGQTLTIGYEFPDLEVSFYTNFLNGKVEAGLGEPPEEPMIQLTMDSDVLDDVFTGKVAAAKAAMKGDLAFSGNVMAAMRLQGLMADFTRLYQQAKSSA